MASLLANAVKVHHAALRRAAGVPGRYFRGNDSIELTLVPGQRDVSGGTYEDIAALNTDSEWLVKASDLALDGDRLFPERKDVIEAELSDGKQTFLVMPPSEGERCWSNSDQYGEVLRVYAKHQGYDEE